MGKYGKIFRQLQIKEFQGYYIDYKKLKKKIKEMQLLLPRISQQVILKKNEIGTKSLELSERSGLSEDPLNPRKPNNSYEGIYNNEIKGFKELLDKEFEKCCLFYKKMQKQLHEELNKHLYEQTNYTSYKINEMIKAIGNLRKTGYMASCLTEYINDNMMAIKKIIKKVDKKFSTYFGNFGPNYILEKLCLERSDLEYLLQFKIIDEASCIIESNVKTLRDYFKELIHSEKGNISKEINEFNTIYNETMGYLKDIDNLIYFKIQYKEWFYFKKKDKLVNVESNLYKAIMLNPILFSAYHKDDLMNKFLSRKEQIKEIEQIQTPLTPANKKNIILIFVQTFFYNSLISGIYPLLFVYLNKSINFPDNSTISDQNSNLTTSYPMSNSTTSDTTDENAIPKIKWAFVIISSTYFFSNFSVMLYNFFGTKRIKISYIISYILFFIGSLLYILSYHFYCDESDESNRYTSYQIPLLISSRILTGLGANPDLGKKYIISYASKYYLPFISKIYVLISLLGHSFGPIIGFILYLVTSNKNDDNICKDAFSLIVLDYSIYNCIGWYGIIFSFLLLIVNILFFTSPTQENMNKILVKRNASSNELIMNSADKTGLISDDFEDAQDKEFYKLQQEKEKNAELEDDEYGSTHTFSQIKGKLVRSNVDAYDRKQFSNIGKSYQKANSLEKNEERDINGNLLTGNNYEGNPYYLVGNDNKEKETDGYDGNFTYIDMIPRTIDDLIRKEKRKFSYINRNLLTIFTILFFENLLKENYIAYCSYYIIKKIEEDPDLTDKKENIYRFLCLTIGISYLSTILSIFFIFPLHKINSIIKKFLVLCMTLTIALLVPLLLSLDIMVFFIDVSLVILLSSFIEVLSSSYLAYLTPPEWKFKQINANALPLIMMTLGKLIGCLICLSVFISENSSKINNISILLLTTIGYGISGFFVIKSNNFRIKAIARVIRKSELDTYIC